jgi:3-phosphoshikimate 1-carboxyvinyltransferase
MAGTLSLPGDKSISHRAAIISALARGETRIANYATSADCASTLACLAALGIGIRREGDSLAITGGQLQKADGFLDCGNSGTTMRLLAGVLAGQGFESVLDGDDSLRGRPMGRVIRPLEAMGAEIGSREGRAPLTIQGNRRLTAIDYEPETASAQLKSCIMLAGLFADGCTTVLERTPTRDHTERMLIWFGAEISQATERDGTLIGIRGGQDLQANDLAVPGDISSAAFFVVAAGLLEGSDLTLPGVGLNPTRTAVLDVLRSAGISVSIENVETVCNEPVGTIRVRGERIGGAGPIHLSGKVIANLIDELPVLAVAGTQIDGGLEVRDAGELRVKESDRIAAVTENLRRMGADVEQFADGFTVRRSKLQGARVDAFGDHRIAMAFAVAGLLAEGETAIDGADCAAVSYPGFYDALASVAE